PSRALCCFFFSSRRRHTRSKRDWSSDVCSSDLKEDCLVLEGCHRILKDSLNSYGHKVSRKMGSLIKNDFYQAMLSGTSGYMEVRSEERRVGKECRCRWWAYNDRRQSKK